MGAVIRESLSILRCKVSAGYTVLLLSASLSMRITGIFEQEFKFKIILMLYTTFIYSMSIFYQQFLNKYKLPVY